MRLSATSPETVIEGSEFGVTCVTNISGEVHNMVDILSPLAGYFSIVVSHLTIHTKPAT